MSEKESLHIVELTAENIKRLKAINIKPNGELVTIGGKNAQGKSSCLDSIMFALAGKSAMPAQPVRKGEEVAIVIEDGEIAEVRK